MKVLKIFLILFCLVFAENMNSAIAGTMMSNSVSEFISDSIVKTDSSVVNSSVNTVTEISTSKKEDTSNIYKAVHVNEELIDKFNKFIKASRPSNYEKYFFSFDSLDYSDIESIKEAWYRYLYGGLEDSNDYAQAKDNKDSTTHSQTDTSKLNQLVNINSDVQKTDTSGTVNHLLTKTDETKTTTDSISKSQSYNVEPKIKKNKKVKGKTRISYQKKNIPSDTLNNTAQSEISTEGFEFQVQIAASRVPLDQKTVSNIYSGEEEIHMIFEDNWYKYSFGKYNSYKAARRVRDNSKVPGAFIILFINGKKVNIREAFASRNSVEQQYEDNISGNIVFRAQIAACRTELPQTELSKIYQGPEKIDLIEEEGWYKYSINCGSNYLLAWKKALEINVPGTFIVPYQNGVRVNIKDILKKN